MGQLVAILEDELDISDLITLNLRKAGFSVEAFQDSDSLMRFLRKQIPDLIILDLMLPDTDGNWLLEGGVLDRLRFPSGL